MKRTMHDLLRDTLRARTVDPAAACVDPETAAALIDGSISARARAAVEAHLADCPRCQALLTALVKLTPPRVERAWWRRPAIAWTAPLAAATALAIWINVRDTAMVAPRQAGDEMLPAVASAPAQPPPDPATDALRMLAEPGSFATRSQAQTFEAPRGGDSVAPSGDARSIRAMRDKAADARGGRQEFDLKSEAAPPTETVPSPSLDARVAPQPANADAEPPQTAQTLANAQLQKAAEASASARTAATQQGMPSALAEAVTIATPRRDRAYEPTIISSNGISQWRIGAAGEVQHSTDRGVTWQTQSTAPNVSPAAGSSPSPSVCWLVGPAGLVLITTDEGRTWRRAPRPTDADLVSVRAIDARRATIVTSDGRTFNTSDGGRNWRRN